MVETIAAEELVDLMEWAETHPELAMQKIQSWWATCGPGFREEGFNFVGCIQEARKDAAVPSNG